MLERGKLAVLAMFVIGILAAAFAWWWNYQGRRKCLDFYGKDAALIIRTGERVELLYLVPDGPEFRPESAPALQLGQQTYRVSRAASISQAKGLIHARTSLLDDHSYSWVAELAQCQPRVEYAVRFSGDSSVTLAFDFGCQKVWHVEQGRSVTMISKLADGWESFLMRQAASFRQPEPARTAPSE